MVPSLKRARCSKDDVTSEQTHPRPNFNPGSSLGAYLLEGLDQPSSVSGLWDRCRHSDDVASFERFVVALDLPFVLRALLKTQVRPCRKRCPCSAALAAEACFQGCHLLFEQTAGTACSLPESGGAPKLKLGERSQSSAAVIRFRCCCSSRRIDLVILAAFHRSQTPSSCGWSGPPAYAWPRPQGVCA